MNEIEIKYQQYQNRVQNHYKNITLMIADHLDIKVKVFSADDFNKITLEKGKSSAPKTLINEGQLWVSSDVSWSLVIHELLHIAVVEPEYRVYLNRDTQEGYAKINKMSPERKSLRSESATLGLQFYVYEHFDLVGMLFGNFFSGNVRTRINSTDIPKIWREKSKRLFDELKIGELCIPIM